MLYCSIYLSRFLFLLLICSIALSFPRTRICSLRTNLGASESADVIVIGAGIGGLSCAAILANNYGLKVHVYESHYHPGGCAHSFPISSKYTKKKYLFDAGPTITFGCSRAPFNPLQQILNAVDAGSCINWIPYNGWGMCTEDGTWDFELGQDKFETGPLLRFAGEEGVKEFRRLREACTPLAESSSRIAAMSLRGDNFRILPLLLNIDGLRGVLPYADQLNGSFEELMDSHVSVKWLRDWLDALAFSISGLPASRTGAAAMAFTIHDMHKAGACLDYPEGGMGSIADVLVRVLRSAGGELFLSAPVHSIGVENGRAAGVKLRDGRTVRAKKAVVCNASIWSLKTLLEADKERLNAQQRDFFLTETRSKEMTKSFLHLHLGMDGTGLLKDPNGRTTGSLRPHYTVMARGMSDPCADRNMVAVSVPSVLDPSLTDRDNGLIVHAYGAGNEPYDTWQGLNTGDKSYLDMKNSAAEYLYESVGRALGIPVSEVKERADVAMVGTPLTHERFLRRERGTYGAAWGAMLPGPTTPLPGLLVCGDSVFPGIGVPAVALSGASAANTVVSAFDHILELTKSRWLRTATATALS